MSGTGCPDRRPVRHLFPAGFQLLEPLRTRPLVHLGCDRRALASVEPFLADHAGATSDALRDSAPQLRGALPRLSAVQRLGIVGRRPEAAPSRLSRRRTPAATFRTGSPMRARL